LSEIYFFSSEVKYLNIVDPEIELAVSEPGPMLKKKIKEMRMNGAEVSDEGYDEDYEKGRETEDFQLFAGMNLRAYFWSVTKSIM